MTGLLRLLDNDIYDDNGIYDDDDNDGDDTVPRHRHIS